MVWGWLQRTRPADDDTERSDASTSVDVVYAEIVRSLSSQDDQFSNIDTKASFVLTASAVIVGLIGYPLIRDQRPAVLEQTVALGTILQALGVFIFLGLAIAVYLAYRPRDMTDSAFAPRVLMEYLDVDPATTKNDLIIAGKDAHARNVESIRSKTSALMWAFGLLMAEIVLLAVLAFAYMFE